MVEDEDGEIVEWECIWKIWKIQLWQEEITIEVYKQNKGKIDSIPSINI